MDRRSFFHSLLGGAIAAQSLDIEKLLWVPGEKTIFIPPAREVYFFTGLTPRYWQLLNTGLMPLKIVRVELYNV